jgi:hypothetical protein
MYPESNTLPKQPCPDRSAVGLVDLARTGRLKAIKTRRNWMTTREALTDYIENIKRKNKKI